MLGTSGLVGSSGNGGGEEGGGGGVVVGSSGGGTSSIMAGIGDDEKGRGGGEGELFELGDRSVGGNRWPRQETLALLKIRSDMDVVFRDSSLKGPLWEEVSRKMAELGFHRSAKKCKEKFENVYKYHKRTKEGRVGKADGKTYRFFDQLEALEQHHSSTAVSSSLPPPQSAVPVTMVMPPGASNITVPSSPHPISVIHAPPTTPHQPQHHRPVNPTNQISPLQQPPMPVVSGGLPPPPQPVAVQSSPIQMEHSVPSSPSSATPSSSSSTSSDEELLGRRKRKRKWKDFFEKLMREVIDKQEELQKRFLEAVEKRENDRVAREEAWKMQEIARLNREHEILVQERSIAAAKDAALISFLQKLSDQQQIPLQLPVQIQTQTQARGPTAPQPQPQSQPQLQPQPQPQLQLQPQPQSQPQIQVQVQKNPVVSAPPPAAPPQPQPLSQLPPQQPQQALVVAGPSNTGGNVEVQKISNNGAEDQNMGVSSSRWPRAEVQALINLRTNMDQKYQESGPKGPLWEEISGSMRKLGYNRNAKRCKEKWENINKYFKKVKESNKKRPEDSKTCPYFHQLEALYREKSKAETTAMDTSNNPSSSSYLPTTSYGQVKPGSVGPILAQPEQQWPPAHQEDQGSEQHCESDEEEDDDDDQGSGYEIVANNAAGSTSTATTTASTRTATAE